MRVHFKFPKDSEKLIIEEHKEVKVIPSTQHSTIGNHQAIPKPKPVHSPDICPSPEKPPHDVDNLISETPPAPLTLSMKHVL